MDWDFQLEGKNEERGKIDLKCLFANYETTQYRLVFPIALGHLEYQFYLVNTIS